MKFFIYNPNKQYFTKIEELFKRSLLDLGDEAANYDNSEYIFCIQHMGPYKLNRTVGKKYILIQVEDWVTKPNSKIPGKHTAFLDIADYVWGFDISNPHEEYIYLGYHPFLDISEEKYTINKNIGFLGGKKGRRGQLHSNSKYKFNSIAKWDYLDAIRAMREYKINIHIHSYKETKFTPWDRITKMLSNKMFFIVEDCYLPSSLSMIPTFRYNNYDEIIGKYIKNDKLMKEISNDSYDIWKKEFDMRKQLELKLGKIK